MHKITFDIILSNFTNLGGCLNIHNIIAYFSKTYKSDNI